jgi:hypothetical protein
MQDSSIIQFSFWGKHKPANQDSVLMDAGSGQLIELFPKAEIIHLEDYFTPSLALRN